MNASLQTNLYPEAMPTAGFGRRLAAFFIDVAPFALLAWGVSALTSAPGHELATQPIAPSEPVEAVAWFLAREARRAPAFALYLVYATILESSTLQATVGKRILGIRVASISGEPVTLRRATLRSAAKILSYLPFSLGFIWALFSRERRAWHDSLSGTRVVVAQTPQKAAA